ncbi:hypothetical protein CYY_000304 [Polysphondylium violaceum]|uniref:Uncharacterized protein n=1 Tax=Polysphondylium violaceum TaxID=133409 RepID=A0A8J4V955_9MYCE|nr:hypothetical protein CYY_000304 [Polysphondylium violaceum]
MESNATTTASNKKGTISISINKDDFIDEATFNLLPCSVGFNGYSRVSSYFEIKEIDHDEYSNLNEKKTKKILESSFRGIKLLGSQVMVPENYRGYLLRDDEPNTEGDKKWEPILTFQKFNGWNRETVPSEFDKTQQFLKSINILSCINKEITQDDIDKELKEYENRDSIKPDTSTTSTSTSTSTTKSPLKIIKESNEIKETNEMKDNKEEKVEEVVAKEVEVEKEIVEKQETPEIKEKEKLEEVVAKEIEVEKEIVETKQEIKVDDDDDNGEEKKRRLKKIKL